MRFKNFCFLFFLLMGVSFVLAGVVVDTAGDVRDINLNLKKEVVLVLGEKIIVDGDEYDAKSGSVFKFDSGGKLIEGTSFVTNEGTFNINGFDVPLPEGSEVSFEKEKVVIKLPGDSEISIESYGEGLIEFVSDGEISVLGMKISGLSDGESSRVFFDGKFYITKAKINDLEVGRLNSVKSYLFSDIIPDDFEEVAILVQDDKIVLRGNSKEESPDVSYTRDGARTTMLALIGGEVEIDFGKDELNVIARGNYKIYNGKLLEKNGLIGNLNEKYYDLLKVTDNSVPMHIVSYRDDGTMKPGETFHLKEGKYVLGYDKGDGIYTTSKGGVYVDDAETRVAFEGLSSEQDEKYSGLSVQERIGVLRKVAKGESVASVFEGISVSYADKVNFNNYGSVKEYPSALQDIKEHQGQIRFSSSDDLGHETVHGINAELRNKYGRGTGTDNAFYLLNGQYVILEEPKLDILRDVNPLLPSQLRTGRGSSFAGTYVNGAFRSWKNEPLYVLDELTSYTNGGIVSLQTGRRKSLNLGEFMSTASALGLAIEQKDSTYYRSSKGTEFRNFLGYSLERAMDVHVRQTVRSGGTELQAKQSFYGMTTPAQRDYLQRTFKESWTQRNLGF